MDFWQMLVGSYSPQQLESFERVRIGRDYQDSTSLT
jgi:hypothetical protein